jgi:ATP-dependent Lon protease
MVMAMLSAFLEIPVNEAVAMTGEITLRGEVLPIGGLNEKLLAARRNGYTTILIPADNKADVAEIRANITNDLNIIPVESVRDALPIVFPQWNEFITTKRSELEKMLPPSAGVTNRPASLESYN